MTLPRSPRNSDPIPNQPFSHPDVATIRGPYWQMPLGSGLEADPYGSVQIDGSTPQDPAYVLYGANGWVGVGNGLTIDSEGEFVVD